MVIKCLIRALCREQLFFALIFFLLFIRSGISPISTRSTALNWDTLSKLESPKSIIYFSDKNHAVILTVKSGIYRPKSSTSSVATQQYVQQQVINIIFTRQLIYGNTTSIQDIIFIFIFSCSLLYLERGCYFQSKFAHRSD